MPDQMNLDEMTKVNEDNEYEVYVCNNTLAMFQMDGDDPKASTSRILPGGDCWEGPDWYPTSCDAWPELRGWALVRKKQAVAIEANYQTYVHA